MNNDLIQKLAMSKKIMDASDRIKPGQTQGGLPMSENIDANYNIPQDMLQPVPQQPTQQMAQAQQMSQPQPVTEDRIQNSKLPDEIKQLMMEHPIQQPNFGGGGGTVLSDDVIEGAQRLMGRTPQQTVTENVTVPSSSNDSDLKQMIRDVVRDTVRDVVREELQNAGMLTEGNTKTNESLQLRVGKHVFEGRVTKIKKVK
jgi:hypothetical protein